MRKGGIKNNNKVIKKIVILILLMFIGICIYRIIDKNNIKEENYINKEQEQPEVITTQKEQTPKTESERMIKLKEYQKENSEIIGWLEIDGTNINYPVLQTTDNKYYITHNYKKEYTEDGSLFLDKSYNFDIPSTNLLIYGHNNQNSNMFSDLLKYKEEIFYKEHPIINFTTSEGDFEYEIIAAFFSRVYYKKETNVFRYYFFIDAKNEQEFNDYVNNSKSVSIYDTGKTATYGEQLLTLSTCSYHTEDGRFAVVARKK